MFRLKKSQIHIILILLAAASVLIFGFFGVRSLPKTTGRNPLSGMEDFSDGWVSSYKTDDEEKLAKAQSVDGENPAGSVTEILSLPETVPVISGKTVTMTQKLPDYGQENIYLLFRTKAEALQVLVDEDLLYESGEKEQNISCTHVVCIDKELRNRIVTVRLTGGKRARMEIQKVSVGTYAGLLLFGLQQDKTVFAAGLVFLVCSIIMFGMWMLCPNRGRRRAVLLYTQLECMCAGVFLILETSLFQFLTGWNFSLYLLKTCILIMAVALHATAVHYSLYRKSLLSLNSLVLVFYGILFISVMVLEAFSLITVAAACRAVEVCAVLGIFADTVILLAGLYRHERQDGKGLCAANFMLTLGICAQLADFILHRDSRRTLIYIALGLLACFAVAFAHGLKLAFSVPQTEQAEENAEGKLRMYLVEQMNPNLLFASFHTLQGLIKKGSANSVKMIYYISVYLRDNLRAVEHAGEIVSFGTELEHIIAYLQLQKTRNQSLNFVVECKEKDFKVPRFSMEPMVENAVKYGIAGNGNKGNVVIRTYRRADGYAVQVIDDGTGFDKKTLKKQSPTALLNLFSVLEHVCNAQVELITKKGKGTVITIILPMLENDLMEED